MNIGVSIKWNRTFIKFSEYTECGESDKSFQFSFNVFPEFAEFSDKDY